MSKKKYYRVRQPDVNRKSWSIEAKEDGRWVRVKSPEMDAVNSLYKSGTLAPHQAKERVQRLLEALYKRRDSEAYSVNVLHGNVKIVDAFIKKTYTPQKMRRLAPMSFDSAKCSLYKAINDLGDMPVEGEAEPIQTLIDNLYRNKPGSHRKRITAINRLRKDLKEELLFHLADVAHDVLYITESQLNDMLGYINNPITKLLASFLFYSGVRIGEAFAVTPQSVRSHDGATLISVTRQMVVKGELGPTKTRSKRRAFIIPGGEDCARKWADLPDKAKYRDMEHNKRIKKAALKIGVKGFYAHCLRHSYCIHLISQGCTIDWVAQSAGHSREVCERYYSTHSLTDDAISMMHKTLKKEQPPKAEVAKAG